MTIDRDFQLPNDTQLIRYFSSARARRKLFNMPARLSGEDSSECPACIHNLTPLSC